MIIIHVRQSMMPKDLGDQELTVTDNLPADCSIWKCTTDEDARYLCQGGFYTRFDNLNDLENYVDEMVENEAAGLDQ